MQMPEFNEHIYALLHAEKNLKDLIDKTNARFSTCLHTYKNVTWQTNAANLYTRMLTVATQSRFRDIFSFHITPLDKTKIKVNIHKR